MLSQVLVELRRQKPIIMKWSYKLAVEFSDLWMAVTWSLNGVSNLGITEEAHRSFYKLSCKNVRNKGDDLRVKGPIS